MIEIRFKDIDPDSGKISQDKLLATSESLDKANIIIHALNNTFDEEPNREFYTRDKSDPDRELTYEERVAWFVSNYYETGMEYEGMLAALKDEDLDSFKWYDEVLVFPRRASELTVQN